MSAAKVLLLMALNAQANALKMVSDITTKYGTVEQIVSMKRDVELFRANKETKKTGQSNNEQVLMRTSPYRETGGIFDPAIISKESDGEEPENFEWHLPNPHSHYLGALHYLVYSRH